MRMEWTKEMESDLIELRQKGVTWAELPKRMAENHEGRFTSESCRGKYRRLNKNAPIDVNDDNPKPYKEKIQINSDGTHTSDKLIELSEEEMKDEIVVLEAHGYDPDEWELTSSQSSMWHHFNREMNNPRTMYASKIKVKPKEEGSFNWDEFLDTIKEVPSIRVNASVTDSDTYLTIPLADLHFGIADYSYYKETQSRIADLINRRHKEILFIIGNDLFHHNDHRNRTASGREIQHTDMIKAWSDARKFYYPLFEKALGNSNKVSVVLTIGNHSETLEWAFVQMIKERFPQIKVDDEFKERKAIMLGLNFIGTNHGDKKNIAHLSENFAVEFPLLWSESKTRTVFVGHRHHERVIDNGGILIRQLPTGAITDDWHDEHGYTMAHKRFQVHEFEYDDQARIHYV